MGLSVLFAEAKIDFKKAEQQYRAGNYAEACEMYKQIILHNSRSATYNHRYAVCLVETKGNYVLAQKHAQYAYRKGIRLSLLPLGKALFYQYRFQEAKDRLISFMKHQPKTTGEYVEALNWVEKCDEMLVQMDRIEKVKIRSVDTLALSKLLSAYNLSEEIGSMEMQSEMDSNAVFPGINFITQRGDQKFFSKYVASDSAGYDIYTQLKFVDSWEGESKLQGSINSDKDDRYPFMLSDGLTLYFSSNGHGSLGGYDIFVTRYNPDSKTFLKPRNLGFPFNSFDDDFLYVPDTGLGLIYFASNRGTTSDSAVVYAIEKQDVKSFVEGGAKEKIQALMLQSGELLALHNNKDNTVDSHTNAGTRKNEVIRFVINDSIVYNNKKQFVSAKALMLFEQGEENLKRLSRLKEKVNSLREEYANVTTEDERQTIADSIIASEDRVFELEANSETPFVESRVTEIKLLGTKKSKLKKSVFQFSEVFLNGEELDYVEFKNFELYKYVDSLFSMSEQDQLKQFDDSILRSEVLINELVNLQKYFENGYQLESTTLTFWNSLGQISEQFKMNLSKQELAALAEKERYKYVLLKEKFRKQKALFITNYLNKNQAIHGNVVARYKDFSYYEGRVEKALSALQSKTELDTATYHISVLNNKATQISEEMLLMYAEHKDTTGNVERRNPKAVEKVDSVVVDTLLLGSVTADTTDLQKKEVSEILDSDNQEFNKALIYKVQVGIFSKPLSNELLEKLDNVVSLKVGNTGLTKYFSGSFKTYDEARDAALRLNKGSFPGAFVVGFKNNKPIKL